MGIDEDRNRIDEIDGELLDLLRQRMEAARRIGREKRAEGIPLYDPVRERQVVERIVGRAGDRFPAEGIRAVYREIISASRALETDRPVLFLGSPGSLAHQATRERFGESAPLASCPDPEAVFDRLDAGEGDYAVLTLESSSLEAHLDRLDLFLHSEVRIFGEFYVVARISVYAPAAVEQPADLFATPALLAGCSRWVERSSQERRFFATGSLEEAVERAAGGGGGALGYPLLRGRAELLERETGLENEPRLPRRFLILGRKDGPPTGRDKTSLLAVIPNRPGALHAVAGVLASHGVNLCWIEPKATPIGTWDHIFFLDLEGHREDPVVTRAVESLRSHTEWLKVLGSYPSERPPGRSFG